MYRSFWVHPARQDGDRVTSQSKRSFPIQCIEISGVAYWILLAHLTTNDIWPPVTSLIRVTQCWSESGLGLGVNGWVRVRDESGLGLYPCGLGLGLHLCGLGLKRCGPGLWSCGLGLGLHPGGLGLTLSPGESDEKCAKQIQTFMCNNGRNRGRN